ncbi:hypothetical protein OE88DRAFT_433467 [Heliocybe sulcata]|uniref:Uncharacterized protein n=1 Tax=Heliocybe sulcata TaxID=5364 RepID=A0A5C3MVD5_9AGAM|nr:hypothetical protein OE88DRAFT_433467 [Heliocybe sulcata]
MKAEKKIKKPEKALEDKKPDLVTIEGQIAHSARKLRNAQWIKEQHTEFTDAAQKYYPESIELIKELTGASQVAPFGPHAAIRRRRPGEIEDTRRVHRPLPPSEAPLVMERRFQVIDFWHLITHATLDWPLAFCDFKSVDAKDFTPTTLASPDYNDETMSVKL